jgi:hypothetical protein
LKSRQPVNKFTAFFDSEGSLPCSHETDTRPDLGPAESRKHSHILLTLDNFSIIISWLCLPSGPFPSGFPKKISYAYFISLTRATCPVHLILLHFITIIIFSNKYKLLRLIIMPFFPAPVTSSLFLALLKHFQTHVPNSGRQRCCSCQFSYY